MTRNDLIVRRCVLSEIEENAYIVAHTGSKECVVVDPGMDPEPLLQELERMQLEPKAFLVTHGHWDHIGGLAEMKRRWPDAPVVVGSLESDKLTDANKNLSAMFGMPMVAPPADRLVDEGDEISFAGLRFKVGLVPGHTNGHLFYKLDLDDGPVLFVGDIIFDGSIGRSDFPGGDGTALLDGIRRKIMPLPDATILYPGHMGTTTIGIQRYANPWFKD